MATVTGTTPITHTEIRRLPRTTGVLSGLLVILLGLWGALIPFVGPYFHYAFGSYQTWHYTSERLWLDIVPGAVAVIGGLMLVRSTHRMSGLIGGWLAVAAGAWFAVGLPISLLWHHAGNPIGAPMGGYTRQSLELLGYFYGLGVLIAVLAAFATGRYYSRPRVVVEDAALAEDAVLAEEAHHEHRVAREDRVAETRDGEPVAARDEPLAARDEPIAARDEPIAARDEPIAARDEPIAARDEPVAEREPLAPRDEPLAAREDEPIAARDDEPLAARDDAVAPTSPTDASATAPETATGSQAGVTYRRRPGLSRWRRR
jgi:hypothetical protein